MRPQSFRNQADAALDTKLRRSVASRLRNFRAQRQASRTVLNCHVYYSGINVQGEGVIRDISLRGCQIEGTVIVKPGTKLTLVLALPDSPTVVDRTVVVWSDGRRFGVWHELLLPPERRRLEKLLDSSDTIERA